MHVHVHHETGEAKVWIEPVIAVAENHGMPAQRLTVAVRLVKEHEDEIRAAWNAHFGR